MPSIISFYLSSLLGSQIFNNDGKSLGTLKEIIAIDGERPFLIAGMVKTKDSGNKIYDWSNFNFKKEKSRYLIVCGKESEISPPENAIFLKKHILDKQIVDIDGKKVVRVNDVRLAVVPSGAYVIAVDVGLEGLLRRLDFDRPVKKVYEMFGKNIPGRFILWSNMEAFVPPMQNIKLSMEYSKLNTLHPSELADIIEELDINTRTAIFDALDHEKAADVMEELESEVQVSLLKQLPLEKAADVLEKMPADEVADILDDLENEKAEELLGEMEKEASEEVRELMEYEDGTVGSIMSTDYITFNENMTVNEALSELRKSKPESDTIYYLYVLDDNEKLTANVSLRDIVVSEPETKLSQIMNKKFIYVKDLDSLNSISDIMSKYSLLAIPVVNHEMKMEGIVVIDDVVYDLMRAKRKKV